METWTPQTGLACRTGPARQLPPITAHTSSCQGGGCLDVVAGEGIPQPVLAGGAKGGQTRDTTLPRTSGLNLKLRGRCVMSLSSHLSKDATSLTWLGGQVRWLPLTCRRDQVCQKPRQVSNVSILWQELGEGQVCRRRCLSPGDSSGSKAEVLSL